MKATIYSKEGKDSGSITLPERIFDVAWNGDLMHEVIVAMQANARAGTAHTKTRGEVNGGGKKPWKQKGTGRARHGSRRSPIWRGGGITFGPRTEKEFAKKINRNVRTKALTVALSQKLRDEEMLFVEPLSFKAPKTKDAKSLLAGLAAVKGMEALATKKKNTALVVLSERSEDTELSFQNMGNVRVEQAKDVSPLALFTYKYVIVPEPEKVIAVWEERTASKKKTS